MLDVPHVLVRERQGHGGRDMQRVRACSEPDPHAEYMALRQVWVQGHWVCKLGGLWGLWAVRADTLTQVASRCF